MAMISGKVLRRSVSRTMKTTVTKTFLTVETTSVVETLISLMVQCGKREIVLQGTVADHQAFAFIKVGDRIAFDYYGSGRRNFHYVELLGKKRSAKSKAGKGRKISARTRMSLRTFSKRC